MDHAVSAVKLDENMQDEPSFDEHGDDDDGDDDTEYKDLLSNKSGNFFCFYVFLTLHAFPVNMFSQIGICS